MNNLLTQTKAPLAGLDDGDFAQVRQQHNAMGFWIDVESVRRDYAHQFPDLHSIMLEAVGQDEYGTSWQERDPEDEFLMSDSTPTRLLDRIAEVLVNVESADEHTVSFVIDLTALRVVTRGGREITPAV